MLEFDVSDAQHPENLTQAEARDLFVRMSQARASRELRRLRVEMSALNRLCLRLRSRLTTDNDAAFG